MFDDELPKPKTGEFPKNLEGLSIDELTEYIEELRMEIIRAEEDVEAKKLSADAASSVFN